MRFDAKTSCLRCGRPMVTGGHTGKKVVCRDCKDVDPEFAQLLLEAS